MRKLILPAKHPMLRSSPLSYSFRHFSSNTAKPKAFRPSRFPQAAGKPISLEAFLLRTRALGLYRSILRGSRRISDQKTKEETISFAREEFRRVKSEGDLGKIRYLISTGKTQWETMERFIDGL